MKKFLNVLFFEAGLAKLAYLILGLLFMFGKGDFYTYLSAASFGIFAYVNANILWKYIKEQINDSVNL